ncbi:MAG: phage tail tube protein [Spirochaetales bacterium]|jgi:hypothetical protein|nr:phage tail tube protein [Spirochaetales bacterium]
MAISTIDGSKTLYTFFPEATAGTPAAGAYQTLRCKAGAKFELARNTFTSADLRADRMESSLSYGTKSGSLTLPIEWSYGTYDTLLEATMGGTWAVGVPALGSDTLLVGNAARTLTFEETSGGFVEQSVGATLGGFTISKKTDAIVEGDFSGVFMNTTTAATAATSVAAATTNPAFDSLTGTITDDAGVITYISGWDLKVEQEVSPNFALGSDSAQSTSLGVVKVSGSINAYFVDNTLRDKYINGTPTTLALVLGDATTGTLAFEMNTVKYTHNTRDNNPLARMETLNFVATYTLADLSSLKITRTAA